MSTNSNIIHQDPVTGELSSIYCHWDGHLDSAGETLLENYTTHEKVAELIALGDLSELKATTDECISYHRWRNEPIEIERGGKLSEHANQEYSYLFKDGKWFYTIQGKSFRPLTTKAIQTAQNNA